MTLDEDKEYVAYRDRVRERCGAMFTRSDGRDTIDQLGGVGRGWWPIVEALCLNIQAHIDRSVNNKAWIDRQHPNVQAAIVAKDVCPQVRVLQIKEKFGGLRFYYEGGDDRVDGMVRMAEAWAARTCEECGAPGQTRPGGWVRTLCDEHYADQLIAQADYNQTLED